MHRFKKHIKNILLAIFGMNLLKKGLSLVNKTKEGSKGLLNSLIVKARIFYPLFSYLSTRLTKENFEEFLSYKNNYDKFVNSSGVRKKFFESTENKIFYAEEFKKYAKQIGRPEFVPALDEYILLIDPTSTKAQQDLIISYQELIEHAFAQKKTVEFDYYVSKLKAYKPLMSRYYRLLARKSQASNVSEHEWSELLNEAKTDDASLVDKITAQMR